MRFAAFKSIGFTTPVGFMCNPAACMGASVSVRYLEQCFPAAAFAVVFCPPGKWTSIPVPPLLKALFLTHVDPCFLWYLSAIIARVMEVDPRY